MRTKLWICLLAAVLTVCLGLSVFFLWPKGVAVAVEIWSQGELKQTLPLAVDRVVTVESSNGVNIVTVKDGKVAVTQADCPDGYCMDRGFCSGGPQIVCLPNRLVLKFIGEKTVDGVAG